jgi:hypothetical protein
MVRFLAGIAIGGAVTYWYMTGQVPFRDEVLSWFARTASSYTAETTKGEADRVMRGNESAARSR